MKIKVGIIGFGRIAKYQVRALQQCPQFKLVAVCDTDAKKENSVSYDVNFYSDHVEMIKKEGIDLIIVSVPNSAHFQVTSQVLGRVPYVLIEKPLTDSPERLNELLGVIEEADSLVNVSYHSLYAKEVQWFVQHYARDMKAVLGSITDVKCDFNDTYIVSNELNYAIKSLNGCWLDIGINALSVVCEFIDPQTLSILDARKSQINNLHSCDVSCMVRFSFRIKDGKDAGQGIISTAWNSSVSSKKTVIGFSNTRAKITMDHSKQAVFIDDEHFKRKLLFQVRDRTNRLTNHYKGVFENLYMKLINQESNILFSKQIHEVLFSIND